MKRKPRLCVSSSKSSVFLANSWPAPPAVRSPKCSHPHPLPSTTWGREGGCYVIWAIFSLPFIWGEKTTTNLDLVHLFQALGGGGWEQEGLCYCRCSVILVGREGKRSTSVYKKRLLFHRWENRYINFLVSFLIHWPLIASGGLRLREFAILKVIHFTKSSVMSSLCNWISKANI